jgi:prepilin-type processing-associated H-X9-DG protein
LDKIKFFVHTLILMKLPYLSNKCHGFTFVELCVVITTLSILSLMLMPALSQTRSKSRAVDCMNNEKQLVMAAKMYADDNRDNWVPNFPAQSIEWVAGAMDWSGANSDNTNTAKLVDPAVSIMAPYVGSYAIYHCPADSTAVFSEGKRVRSVSMNEAVGTVGVTIGSLVAGSAVNGIWLTGNNIGTARQTIWRTYGKTSDMNNPRPASLWIFTDEHPNSINDGSFAVQMATTGPFASIINFPGSFHNGAGSFSFADGHTEIHKWIGNTIRPPVVVGGIPISGTQANDSGADIQWLQLRASAKM